MKTGELRNSGALSGTRRLYVQHFMWRCRLRYLLHPAISTANPDLRIVDIGTGNA